MLFLNDFTKSFYINPTFSTSTALLVNGQEL